MADVRTVENGITSITTYQEILIYNLKLKCKVELYRLYLQVYFL